MFPDPVLSSKVRGGFSVIPFLFLAARLTGFTNAQTLLTTTTVPGYANPFLAGQPDGTSAKSDTAPAQSPVMAAAVAPGDVLTFTVTGSVSYSGGVLNSPPDGTAPYSAPSEPGIAGYTTPPLPIDALLGVFLADGAPAAPAPAETVYPAAGLAYTVLAPEPRQIFYIGDGLTGTGSGKRQEIVVPAGATRLFLGTADGFGWYNNTGAFEVTIDRVRRIARQANVSPTAIHFDKPTYQINPGEAVTGSILTTPVPAGGLYSQGLVLTVRGRSGSLAGFVTPVLSSTLNFHGVLPDRGGEASPGAGVGGLKASARFSETRETLRHPTLGSFTIENLPSGTYDVALHPWNELGATEDIFVNGFSETLDGFITFQPSVVEVAGPPLPEAGTPGPMVPGENGLIEQKIPVTNPSAGDISCFRLFVSGLPAGVELWSAHGKIDGVPYIDFPSGIPGGGSSEIRLEYYREDGGGVFQPAPSIIIAPCGAGGSIDYIDLWIIRKDAEGALLEFKSIKDRSYVFEYSEDLINWTASPSAVPGTGGAVQWLDNGPPKTVSFPSNPRRFYRLFEE